MILNPIKKLEREIIEKINTFQKKLSILEAENKILRDQNHNLLAILAGRFLPQGDKNE